MTAKDSDPVRTLIERWRERLPQENPQRYPLLNRCIHELEAALAAVETPPCVNCGEGAPAICIECWNKLAAQRALYENAQCITCATHLDEAAVETPQAQERDRCSTCSTLTWCDYHNCCLAETLAPVARETPSAPSPQAAGAVRWQCEICHSKGCSTCHEPGERCRCVPRLPPSHRCAGCGHRWTGRFPGATLCGTCWRKGQAAIFGKEPTR